MPTDIPEGDPVHSGRRKLGMDRGGADLTTTLEFVAWWRTDIQPDGPRQFIGWVLHCSLLLECVPHTRISHHIYATGCTRRGSSTALGYALIHE